MYHSTSPSSSQGSMGPSGLIRYGSAPGSFLSTAVDSVVGRHTRDFSALGSSSPHFLRHFSDADTSSATSDPKKTNNPQTAPYGSNEIAFGSGEFSTARINLNSKSCGSSGGGGSLLRQSSSPAGLLNHLASSAASNGFPVTRGMGSYNSREASDNGHGISRLASQLSFTRQDSLSHIPEESENGHKKAAHSYATASFGTVSWDNSNAVVFSASPGKRAKTIGGGDAHCLNTVESQFQFSLSETDLEMATTGNLLQIPQDAVACKIRAKRGFATHPRSIAERDRRTRINGKLKKLQELVPNLEKQQTCYADMLDFAVQHIKGLENQLQKLKDELEHCTCGCKQTT
ncbi:transcription factor bHLH128-like isoform X1 [Actinidia eriantha]|uniref:transcription factor bHLH128-like isoform X1 n=1 Tax=Actinidia eriantha TaxID=165200 RepID=UPI002584474E|nr:transcription factor bHLH128-like isoform X1 [Actinidia eriantha]